jgi:ketosteroid isomerase-like protein
MNMADSSFNLFMQQRRSVAAAFVNGDPSPLREISTATDPATFFGPGGGVEQGATHVLEINETGSNQFQRGGTTELEVLHSGADGDLGYWTGWQNATVRVAGKAEPMPMRLRVTEVFRREAGVWKLIHRHADPLAEKAKH